MQSRCRPSGKRAKQRRVSEATLILERAQQGDPKAAEALLPLVYEELRCLAASKMATQPPGQTLQATALVHEAWLKLAGDKPSSWRDRQHFFRAAAAAMRQILIDRARRHHRRDANRPHRPSWRTLHAPGLRNVDDQDRPHLPDRHHESDRVHRCPDQRPHPSLLSRKAELSAGPRIALEPRHPMRSTSIILFTPRFLLFALRSSPSEAPGGHAAVASSAAHERDHLLGHFKPGARAHLLDVNMADPWKALCTHFILHGGTELQESPWARTMDLARSDAKRCSLLCRE